ncbi:MAG: histidine kinase dimerization/phospho-acceptor domain-containing protein [Gammaproteobacteria bacterium]
MADTHTPITSDSDGGTDAALNRLLQDERDTALRTLAGRLAHQIRNPLAAVRAACTGLHAELEDPEQRETLEMTLAEVDRMLGFVRATVDSLPDPHEAAAPCALDTEIRDVVTRLRVDTTHGAGIALGELEPCTLTLPRRRLRVALYSLLKQLGDARGVESLEISLHGGAGQARIVTTPRGAAADDGHLSTGMISPSAWGQPVGLLVAERFARDHGGSLQRNSTPDDTLNFTLTLRDTHG